MRYGSDLHSRCVDREYGRHGMKLLIQNGLLYVDNKRFCYAKVNDGSQTIRSEQRKVSTQYSHHHGRILPMVDGAGCIADDDQCYIRIGSVLGSDGPIKCVMSLSGLVARIEAAEEFGSQILIEVK